MKMIFRIVAIYLLCFCFMNGNEVTAEEGTATVSNPGFEESSTGDEIPGWNQIYGDGNITISDSISYMGDYSLHILDENTSVSYGLESDLINITPGSDYKAAVMANVTSGRPMIYIRFYNSDMERIDQKNVGTNSIQIWEELSVSATAPEDAVYASILLYTSVGGASEVHFDDVTLHNMDGNNNAIHLGSPIQSVTIPGAAYGKGVNGEDLVYAVTNGNPATFNVLNANTGERIKSFKLAGVHNSWGLTVTPDNTVYIGTQRNGYLYRWVPGSDEVENLGRAINGETNIWRLTADDEGRVYGGTYPTGKVFQYNPETNQFHDYGQLIEGVKYVRSITSGRGKIYAGLGTPAYLVELDPNSGNKEVIPLPEEFQDESYVYDLTFAGNLLFARMSPSDVTLVYDTVKNRWVNEIENTPGFDVSTRGPKNKVYLRKDTEIYAYDLRTHELESTGLEFFTGVSASRSFGWINIGGRDYPGRSLASINSRGDIFIYNPLTGNHKIVEGDVEGQPNDIQSLAKGPDGNIYIGGYLSPQGMGVYNPETGTMNQLDGISQIEGMGTHDGKLYMGTYPGANIYEYDPNKTWDFGTNARLLFSLSGDYKQDRPFAFTSAGNRLAIGTVPDYGELGGALTLFDPTTEEYQVYRDVVENQSIIELNYKNGFIYGGTSVWGGYGIEPVEEEAKMFIWDVTKDEKVWEGVPVAGEEAVSAITFDEEGYLWGLTAGYLFKFDPETHEVLQSKLLFPYPGGSMYYTGRDLAYDQDGYLYGATLGKVFRVDPDTFEVKVLAENATLFAQDRNGDIYFTRSSELYKIEK